MNTPPGEQPESPTPTRADDAATIDFVSPPPQDVEFDFLNPSGRSDSLGRLGHYEVLEVIGQGAFGIVFRAFDEVLQRVVAMKVLSPKIAVTSLARKRFLREARAGAQVRHENVVRIHAVEELPLPYMVMEFVPGETLQQRLDRTGPLDVAEVAVIGQQIAEGLAAAHGAGLIHRDVKPANILVEAGLKLCVKITDFGLARAGDDASLTQDGTMVGTPLYMSPEQAQGSTLDHRSDLFSLGSVLYAITSGRPPFGASSMLAVLKRVAEETPRSIPEMIPETPVWLCRLIAKLLAKNPAERFQTAAEVNQAIELGVASPRTAASAASGPPVRWRRRLLFVGGFLLLVALSIGTYLLTRSDPGPIPSVKREPPRVGPGQPGATFTPRRLSDVIDRAAAAVKLTDEFADPNKSDFAWGGHARAYRDGRIIIDDNWVGAWGNRGHRFTDFACELVGRTTGAKHKGWGIAAFKDFGEGTPLPASRGFEVLLDSEGRLFIVPCRWVEKKDKDIGSIGPLQVASFRKGEFNSLVLILQEGNKVAVFVNEIEACEQIELPYALIPAQIQLTTMGGIDETSRLEFKRIQVWSTIERIAP